MTWEAHNSSPLDHLPHPRAGREQHHRLASPVAPCLIDDEDKEVERLASRYPDLRDWLEFTGWHVADHRMRQLHRFRRIEERDDKDDRPPKYYRTNQNQRGSRPSGYQSSRGPITAAVRKVAGPGRTVASPRARPRDIYLREPPESPTAPRALPTTHCLAMTSMASAPLTGT